MQRMRFLLILQPFERDAVHGSRQGIVSRFTACGIPIIAGHQENISFARKQKGG